MYEPECNKFCLNCFWYNKGDCIGGNNRGQCKDYQYSPSMTITDKNNMSEDSSVVVSKNYTNER